MKKELKPCTGVLLRADLTELGQFSRFLPKRVGWLCPVRSALEWTPMQEFNHFNARSLWSPLLAPLIKKLETYFALLYFWTFAVVQPMYSKSGVLCSAYLFRQNWYEMLP